MLSGILSEKPYPTKMNFMILGTIYVSYTEQGTLWKLVLVIPPQPLEAGFSYYSHFI